MLVCSRTVMITKKGRAMDSSAPRSIELSFQVRYLPQLRHGAARVVCELLLQLGHDGWIDGCWTATGPPELCDLSVS